MRKNRPRADDLGISTKPHWITVEDLWHKLLRSQLLPPGTDLMKTYLDLLVQYHNGGWKLNDFSSDWARFYASKDGEKHYIQVTSLDPALPKYLGPTDLMSGHFKKK